MRRIILILLFVCYEIVAFYVYSLVWMKEADPRMAGDSSLKLLAWICIMCGFAGFIVFGVLWVKFSNKSSR